MRRDSPGINITMHIPAVSSTSIGLLWESLRQVKIPYIMGGLGLMLGYVGCEALCTRQILGRLGHGAPYRRCLGYSFVGFYVSSITPSATGGQPAQIYCMSRDPDAPYCISCVIKP
mgnify:CR=1 FL=1